MNEQEIKHYLYETGRLEDMVDLFAHAMKHKLRKKYLEGQRGWDDPKCKGFILESLEQHVKKGDFVDVANLAAMLWNFERQ